MQHYHFEKISSTSDYAKELVNPKDNIVVTADYQTAGHGRNGKTWLGLYGENCYFSLGVWHHEHPDVNRLSVMQALGVLAAKQAVVEATDTAGHNIFLIKYPNDLMAVAQDGSTKKICGVLAEHDFMGDECISSIVGIGINVRQTEFDAEIRDTSISLKLLGFDVTPNTVNKLLIKYSQRLLSLGWDELFNLWKKELNITGKSLTIVGEPGLWTADEILPDGRLGVSSQEDGSRRLVDNGDSVRYSLL